MEINPAAALTKPYRVSLNSSDVRKITFNPLFNPINMRNPYMVRNFINLHLSQENSAGNESNLEVSRPWMK